MNYNFYANEDDKEQILQFIFKETDLRVFDSYSSYEREISEYKTLDEILSKFDLINGGEFAVAFQLWTPRHKGNIMFRRIELDPKKCNGYTFRYSTDGWGLIRLYFGGMKDNQLHKSQIGHFDEKGALGKENFSELNGKVSDWDWKEVNSSSRKLRYQIQNRLSLKKVGSSGVMAGAAKLEQQGIKLV